MRLHVTSTFFFFVLTGNSLICLAQDKPNRIRAYYTLPVGYEVRYLERQEVDAPDPTRVERKRVTTNGILTETVTEIRPDPGSKIKRLVPGPNKRVGWKHLRLTVKQKGDTVYYVPWPFLVRKGVDASEKAEAETHRLQKRATSKQSKASHATADSKKAIAAGQASNLARIDAIEQTTADNGAFYEVIGQKTNPSLMIGTYITVPYRTVEYGVIAIPFRAYLATSSRDYLPSVANGVGLYLGYNQGWTNFYRGGTTRNFSLIPALYLAGASVDITKNNIRPGTFVADKSTEPAITGGFALLVGREDLTVGAVLGRDFPLTPTGRQWTYASAAYLGVVVSLQISAFK